MRNALTIFKSDTMDAALAGDAVFVAINGYDSCLNLMQGSAENLYNKLEKALYDDKTRNVLENENIRLEAENDELKEELERYRGN